MATGILGRLRKSISKFRKDDLAEFSSEEREKLETVLRERKLELIAKSRLQKLEDKLTPKPKKKMKEVFAEIKTFREANLKRRAEQLARTEGRKKRFKEIEEKRIEKGKLIPTKGKIRKPFTPTRL